MNANRKYVFMLAFLLLSAAFTTYLTHAREHENVPARETLDHFPDRIGQWQKADTQTLDNRVLGLLAPDDYLSRTYINAEGRAVFLFIAFYVSQRSGKTIHSPQNCLPGAGWEITQRGQVQLTGERPATINDFTIAKEQDRMVAYYWYQGRGRIQANEYWDKIYGVQDAVLKNRTDAALVRVMINSTSNPEIEAQTRRDAMDFIKQIQPELPRFIPN